MNACFGNSAHTDITPFLSHTAHVLALLRLTLQVQILQVIQVRQC